MAGLSLPGIQLAVGRSLPDAHDVLLLNAQKDCDLCELFEFYGRVLVLPLLNRDPVVVVFQVANSAVGRVVVAAIVATAGRMLAADGVNLVGEP